MYQVIYDRTTGKLHIEYIGQGNGGSDTEDYKNFILTADYNKSKTSINITARDPKYGVEKLEIIYKGEIVKTINKPKEQEQIDISEIGKGEYCIKGTSGSGKVKYAWVEVETISEKLTPPEVIVKERRKRK